MIPDPNDEIRAIRDKLSAKCDYDLDRIFEETVRQQMLSGRTFLAPPKYVQERRNALVRRFASDGNRTPANAKD
jgi:hypothetical protein